MSLATAWVARTITRLWTHLYTAGLPRPERERRREEVEADVWETVHEDPRERGMPPAAAILGRLLTGIADDIGWRVEMEAGMTRTRGLAVAAATVGGLAVLWTIAASRPPLPPVPATPQDRLLIATLAAPPPPSPPPVLPGERAPQVTFTYADVSYGTVDGTAPPIRVNEVRPVHPPIARINGIGGTVVVEATVDESGHVSAARITESVPMLNQSALDAVRQWVFQPPGNGASPKSVTLRATLTYPTSPSPAGAPR